MNSRQRNVLIRIVIAVVLFLYVAWLSYRELAPFDFRVVTIFFGLYLLWTVLAETLIYQDPDSYVTEDDDQKTYLYVQISFLIALFFAAIDFVELNWTRNRDWEPFIIYIGFIMFLVSCLVRWWGFKSIGRFFNPRVAVYENHELINSGAYAKIRHPLYLGSLLSILAIPLVFNSWGGFLIVLLITVPAILYRIKVEEDFMLRHFGEEYQEYIKDTWKLIPHIW